MPTFASVALVAKGRHADKSRRPRAQACLTPAVLAALTQPCKQLEYESGTQAAMKQPSGSIEIQHSRWLIAAEAAGEHPAECR